MDNMIYLFLLQEELVQLRENVRAGPSLEASELSSEFQDPVCTIIFVVHVA